MSVNTKRSKNVAPQTKVNNQSLAEIMTRKDELRHESVFILDHGWHELICFCSTEGLSVMLPNLLMSPELIMQTFLKMDRLILVTSKGIWEGVKSCFHNRPILQEKVSVLLF